MAPSKARRSWSTLFGFGSVPGSPAEARAFLQRRVTLYIGLALGLWTIGTGFDAALRVLPPLGMGDASFGDVPRMQLAGTVLLAVSFLAARRGERSTGFLHAVDAGGTLVQAAILCAGLAQEPPRTRPELGTLLALAHILVARAAIVPSTPARTGVAGAAVALLLTGAAARTYLRGPLPAGSPSPWVFVASAATWMTMTTLLTTVLSRVIYGLRQEVTEALALGQYTLLEKLGEGGMGVVYRARHALMKRPTAVKVLPPDRAGDAAIARFEREVELTSRLTHPHTIVVHDFGRTPEGLFYYAMEYVDGLDLGALVRLDGPQPPGRVLLLLAQAASSLEEAHGAGLVHRDIKPENLLLCERGPAGDFLKVLDFGLVKEMSGASAPAGAHEAGADGAAGTPLYMAPEAISGRGVDGRSDLYSLGAVAYHLLVGSPVFEGTTMVEVCARHLHAPVEPISQRAGRAVPSSLAAIVHACLAKSPADRPASATELLSSLAACDDVPPWTAEDARRWWAERGPSVREQARRARDGSSRGVSRLRVDLTARGGSGT